MERHKLQYEVLNHHNPNGETGRHWEIDVHATPEELQTLAERGYLVREGLFEGEALEKLRDALEGLEEREWEKTRQRDCWKERLGVHPASLDG